MATTLSETEKKGKTNLIGAHFFRLPSQGNIYTLTPLTDAKGLTKLLVASLQRKIYCLEYCSGRPLMREVPFTYIPGGAEVISLDAVNRSVIQQDFIVGITIIKKDNDTEKTTCFFNVYSDWDLTCDSALDVVSQNCLPLELSYIPYCLYHTQTYGKNGWETVWLLSGSDCLVHLYLPDDESHSYQEVDSSVTFPEFKNVVGGITLGIDVLYSSDYKRRTTATSGEDGKVQVFSVNMASTVPEIKSSRIMVWDYPSPSVKLFNLDNNIPIPDVLQAHVLKKRERAKEKEVAAVTPHIVVANSLESCFVYRNCFDKCEGFQLHESDAHDIVTCSIVCDIDQDGDLEIIIGTYGQVILIYKNIVETGQWLLHQTLRVPCPILSMVHCDVIGDGTLQLIVMTTRGIHIYQHDPREVAAVLLSRLERLFDTDDTSSSEPVTQEMKKDDE